MACDESTDTVQLLHVFAGSWQYICIVEELHDLKSLKGTSMGKDIF